MSRGVLAGVVFDRLILGGHPSYVIYVCRDILEVRFW